MRTAIALALLAVLALVLWRMVTLESGAGSLEQAPVVLATETATQPAPQQSVESPSAAVGRESAEPAALPEESAPTFVDPAATKATGTLLIRVVSRENRQALARCPISVFPAEISSAKDKLAINANVLTDSDGRAEFEVESGRELRSTVTVGVRRPAAMIPALSPGEERELEIDIPTEPDLTVCGRLIDIETKQPITNGIVRLERRDRVQAGNQEFVVLKPGQASEPERAGDEVRARADGSFKLQVKSWLAETASAKADGYARAFFLLEPGHESPDQAQEVRMPRSASLGVRVHQRGVGIAGVKVTLSTKSYKLRPSAAKMSSFSSVPVNWSAKTDATGRAEVGDLPPDVPLNLILAAPGAAKREESEPLSFTPGERRSIEIHLGEGATISGSVLDGDGQPLAQQVMWRVVARSNAGTLFRDREEVSASATSDENGRFRFDDVPAGGWLIGPAAPGKVKSHSPAGDDFAPLAQFVVVETDTREVEITVRVDHGLYLSGVVLDPNGAAVARNSVVAIGDVGRVNLSAVSDARGAFRLGPLPSGSYQVSAGAVGLGDHARSDNVAARAGDSGLVLKLRAGGAIEGRVVDATGALRSGRLTLGTDAEFGARLADIQDGEIRFEGLLPSSYSISATTDDGQCGRVSGLFVRAGETLRGIEIVVAPGAKLKLRYAGKQPHSNYRVSIDGVLCAVDGIERGSAKTISVPAGALEIRWSEFLPSGQIEHRQQVTLAVGEEREMAWNGSL